MKIAVVGAFGLMAEASLYDLAASPVTSRIYAVDVNLERAKSVLARIPNRRKIQPIKADLADIARTARLLKGSECVLNCAWYEYNLKAMDLSQALKAHYVDLGGLYHATLKQLKRDSEFKRMGRLGVLGCGSTPGITNMMVATMSRDFDTISTVGIYDASHDPVLSDSAFLPPFSIRTMLAEYELPAPIWEGGRLKNAAAHSRQETMDFKPPIGRMSLGAVIHSEVATLPGYLKDKGVKDLCFKIAYPESVKKQLAMLVGMGLSRTQPVRLNGASVSPVNFVTALARQSVAAASGQSSAPPKDSEVLRIKIVGTKRGQSLVKTRDCEIRPAGHISAGTAAVGFTGSMASLMVMQGWTIMASGVAAPESSLEEDRFFRELKARKIFRFVETAAYPVA